ncbi:fimbria/pilus outer membrane usher protein [Xanthomonas sontii]|uniref:fimbria/pilus outer membrane usher protein n=1 Tax=Xanthomonas sontii TaxID=2650745 RepID=UPI003F84AAC1
MDFRIIALFVALFFPRLACAKLHFDPALLGNDTDSVADLSRFEMEGRQLPGIYPVEIYLNERHFGARTLKFLAITDQEDTQAQSGNSMRDPSGSDERDSTGLMACLTKKELLEMGVRLSAYPALADVADGTCLSPGRYIPQAFTAFDFQKMRLDISIPQAALKRRASDWIDPKQWDNGVNAGLLNYYFNGEENSGREQGRSQYLNLTAGLNWGPWRLRNNFIWSHDQYASGSRSQWRHINAYAQRALIPWRSELTLGDGTTGSDVFDPISFRGVEMASDDDMYPDSMRGFAPLIQGVAYSNARVSVRQNGNEIYRMNVASGPFLIDDLYPLSNGGDLKVVVIEANGSTHTTIVPYSSVPVLQRQGHFRYDVALGRYRSGSGSQDTPAILQATLLRGLSHNVTAYTGSQLSPHYRAFTLGGGMNIGRWGAVSLDLTQADSVLADRSHHSGQSLRFLYGRSLVATGTTIRLTGYRYSTQGFHTLQETTMKTMSGWLNDDRWESQEQADSAGAADWSQYYDLHGSKRERFQMSLSQRLGHSASLYLNGSHETYWHGGRPSTSLQLGFVGTFKKMDYSLAFGYSQTSGELRADPTLSLSVSLPLDHWFSRGSLRPAHNLTASYNVSRDAEGLLAQQAGLSGTALRDKNLSWSVAHSQDASGGHSDNAEVDYQGAYGDTSLGYARTAGDRQIHYGVSGGMVLHSGGLTLGQALGDTNILVVAPGAADVGIDSGVGIHTDRRGYALIPYASRYRNNRVGLDVGQLDDHTDIDNSVTQVTPTRGAVVRAKFNVRSGVRALVSLTKDGHRVPFGASVHSSEGVDGMVDQDGQAYLSGLEKQGTLSVRWGDKQGQQCTATYAIPAQELDAPVAQVQATCHGI